MMDNGWTNKRCRDVPEVFANIPHTCSHSLATPFVWISFFTLSGSHTQADTLRVARRSGNAWLGYPPHAMPHISHRTALLNLHLVTLVSLSCKSHPCSLVVLSCTVESIVVVFLPSQPSFAHMFQVSFVACPPLVCSVRVLQVYHHCRRCLSVRICTPIYSLPTSHRYLLVITLIVMYHLV